MDITIKNATLNDLQKVQELNLKLFEKEYKEYDSLLNLDWTLGKVGTKYYKDRISKDDGCVLIAIVDNKIVGYLCGGLIPKKAEAYRNLPIMAELENTFVLNEFRSKGIGKKLYDEFIKWCKTKGVGKIKVEASAQNELAIKFYRANNFKDYTLVLEADL
jgi:ribosomal protein S18 acetylase RimI-like enzyme